MTSDLKLTKNQKLVYDVLLEAETPLSAYAILESLRHDGLKAPAQIYRALEKLLECHAVHRIESLNAFVACRHESCAEHNRTHAFTICENCKRVQELDVGDLTPSLSLISNTHAFKAKQATLEISGVCQNCAHQADA